MRLFLAQQAFLDDYTTLQERLTPCLCCRWRPAESLHATLLFTGRRFSAEQIVEAVASLAYTLDDAPIAGIGRFAHNRILYAASEHPTLVQTYRSLAGAFGMERTREYIPHVTLMRYKQIDVPCFDDVKTLLEQRPLGRIGGPLKLMKSTLTPEGAFYETVHTFER